MTDDPPFGRDPSQGPPSDSPPDSPPGPSSDAPFGPDGPAPSDDPPFGPDELAPYDPDEDPDARVWLYVLTRAVTVHRDQVLILDSDGREFIPAFQDRASAREFLERLKSIPDEGAGGLFDQAMHVIDVRRLAKEVGTRVLVLSGRGAVLETIEPLGEGRC